MLTDVITANTEEGWNQAVLLEVVGHYGSMWWVIWCSALTQLYVLHSFIDVNNFLFRWFSTLCWKFHILFVHYWLQQNYYSIHILTQFRYWGRPPVPSPVILMRSLTEHSHRWYKMLCLYNISTLKDRLFYKPGTSMSRQVCYLHNTATCQQAVSVSKCHISAFTWSLAVPTDIHQNLVQSSLWCVCVHWHCSQSK